MSGESDEVEFVETQDVPIKEIFNCIGQVEGVINDIPRLLWRLPRDFYNFLIKEIVEKNDAKVHPLFNQGSGSTLPLHQLMLKAFEALWPHDTPPTTSEELISSISWEAFISHLSAQDLYSMCFPLAPIIESLEHLKVIRIEQCQKTMNQELKRKQSTGLTDFVKKSKTVKATEDSRDPSLSLTSTSSRIMNTCK
jgi:hypothetical protein